MSVCHGCAAELPPQNYQGRTRKWCSERCRKGQYAGTCADCGAPTNGYDGPGLASERCRPCRLRRQHETRVWTPEVVVEAIKAWHAKHGFVPGARDWNPPLARNQRAPDLDLIERRYHDGAWPASSTVIREFGSWNDAIKAAGFEPNQPGHYGRAGEDLTSFPVRRAIALYEGGLSATRVADRVGVAGVTVRRWLKASGVPMRSPSEAARSGWDTRRDQVAA